MNTADFLYLWRLGLQVFVSVFLGVAWVWYVWHGQVDGSNSG